MTTPDDALIADLRDMCATPDDNLVCITCRAADALAAQGMANEGMRATLATALGETKAAHAALAAQAREIEQLRDRIGMQAARIAVLTVDAALASEPK